MKKFIIILLSVVTLSATSCNKWLDVNTNPNYPAEVSIDYLLPGAQMYLAEAVGYNLNLVGSFWSHYVVQCSSTNQYYTIMDYNLPFSASYFRDPWNLIYSKVLPELKEIQMRAADEGKLQFVYSAKALAIYSFYLLTSLYDECAYTYAYASQVYNTPDAIQDPHFDSGKDMQAILIENLQDLRDNFDVDELKDAIGPIDKADLIFAGDIDLWIQFVNTLYLKVLMRDFETNQVEIEALLAEDNFLSEDMAFAQYVDEANKSNPLFESDRRGLNTPQNIRACNDILGVMSDDDPRLTGYYYAGISTSDLKPIYGQTFGGADYGTTAAQNNSLALALYATLPVYFSTVDEAEFLKAEAYARLGGHATEAQTAYEAGISASFARAAFDDDAADFIAGDYAFDSAASDEAMVEQIINQKWASAVLALPIESWFDMNRTGYPTQGTTITAHPGVLGAAPCRFFYPQDSFLYNPNSPATVSLTTKMWWQK